MRSAFLQEGYWLEGATFDPKVHGHWSAQRGPNALVTLFVRD